MAPSDDECTRYAPDWLATVARGGREKDSAAHRLFKCFYRRLVNLLRSTFRFDELTAEEIAQTAMIKGLNAAGKFRGNARVYTWFATIAINEGRNHISSEKRRPDRPSREGQDPWATLSADRMPADEHEGAQDPPEPSGLESMAMELPSSDLEAFQACLDRQFALFYQDHADCGQWIRRFYFEGLSSKQLAAEQGKSDDAMRTQLKSCRHRLRAYLAVCQEFKDG